MYKSKEGWKGSVQYGEENVFTNCFLKAHQKC